MIEFFTISNNSTAEIVEKKSRFIANIYPISNIEEAEKIIKEIKKKYYDAKHHCIAYRIFKDNRIIERLSDDGEPSGTAGAPMLSILQGKKLCNILVVVTRYFGGILLGTGGLVRVYSEAENKAIQNSILIKKVEGVEFQIEIEYSNLESFKHYCKINNIKIFDIKYYENVELKVEMDNTIKNSFIKDIDEQKLKIINIVETCQKIVEMVEKN